METELEKKKRVLGQVRPAGTSNTTLYAPNAGFIGSVLKLYVCNNTGGAVACRVFVDEDGTTFDESTAIAWDKSVGANDFIVIEGLVVTGKKHSIASGGAIGVRSATGNALTFTAFGYEVQ